MKSFSSVISEYYAILICMSLTLCFTDKTGKKFAPKAPARRAPAPARRPSVTQQSPAGTPQPQSTPADNSQNDTADPSLPVVEETEKSTVTESLPSDALGATEPIPAPATTANQTATSLSASTAQPTAIPKPTSISKPTPLPRTPISKPTRISKPTPVSRPPQRKIESTPLPVSTSTNEAQNAEERGPEHALLEYARIEAARTAGDIVVSSESQLLTQHDKKDAQTEAPPAKRAKKSVPVPAAKSSRENSTSAAPSASSSRRGSQSVVHTIEDPHATPDESSVSTPEPSTRPKKRKYSKADNLEADGTEKPKRLRKKREPTPDDAETVEIAPNVMRMSELCKDLRTGKKSKREVELRKMDREEEERKKLDGTPAAGTPIKEPEPEKIEQPSDWKPQSGPKMRIVNGEIVLDNTSLQVDRHADAAREAGELEDVVENSFTRKINQATYGKRSKTETWDETMTDLFYRGLRIIGTDFMAISKLFPGRSRRQIKLKFNNEERRDPQRIKDTLLGIAPREQVDVAMFSQLTNTTFDDPKVVQRELDEEKQRIEAQYAKEQELQQEMLRNPASGDVKDEKNDTGNTKKTRKKQVKNTGAGGTEEVLGSIDDFPAT